ncbi:MAG: phenylalanine--tRNA ligase subunit beta [Candidatus Accumulibacter sp.]|jgi:phenylalanyl-tRNA synthetase beta chain|nr:phenylalanine--tRNA ligase subunit beta [Accumulibacter sp.]
MKFSESWLRSFVAPSVSGEALSHLLTMAGLEVEEEQPAAPPFDTVRIARVLTIGKHPNADRLSLCRVDVGEDEMRQIICGAPNVSPGIKVPCALPGATLPGNLKIKAAKVRGIESSGMLCSAKELGLSEDASGLLILPDDAPVGEDLRVYLDLDDTLRTLKLTPNRADCLSLMGIAREVSALTRVDAVYPDIPETPVGTDLQRPIVLEAPDACPLYCGRILVGANAKASTPDWMKRRLERSGVRSISALVDITNYVMLELGQPLHAFDNTKLKGTIRARRARPGETILLLNGQTLELREDVLLIADDVRPVAMAGIMGGDETGITPETSEIFLESAFFSPHAVAGRARRYGFGSEASYRFERGVDFGGIRRALERASGLILEICGGQAGPLYEAAAILPERKPICLRPSRVARLLGVFLGDEEIAGILRRLGMNVERDGENFIVIPPSFRFDLEIEADLIEEIARLHGYDNIPSPISHAGLMMLPQSESERGLSRIRQILVGRGFQEVINFAFVDEEWEKRLSGNTNAIRLSNPIAAQMSVMRSSLLSGLVANLVTNLKRKQNRVRLFEAGRCFFRDPEGMPVAGFSQPWKLAAIAYGTALPEQWATAPRNVDFFDLKGDIELLLAPYSEFINVRFEKIPHPALHPGRSATLSIGEKPVGVVGELHPQWVQRYEFPLAPIVFEIDLDILRRTKMPKYAEVSQQPLAIRDLSVVVDQKIEIRDILEGLNTDSPACVREIKLFDVYTGKGVDPGKKSLAFRIVMQDTQRTLQDMEVDAAVQRMLIYLQNSFAAQIRT